MANMNKIIIVAALDGNFRRQPFGKILDIIPLAESVIKLSAICMKCQSDASFSKRITEETEENLVGGSDIYTVLCRECYHEANKYKINNMFLLNNVRVLTFQYHTF